MKKSRFFVVGMLAAALAFGLILAGCDNGSTSSSEWWEGRYNGGGNWLELSTGSVKGSSIDSEKGSVTVSKKQGDIKANDEVVGEWAYISWKGDKVGIVCNVTGGSEKGQALALGVRGLTGLLDEVGSEGITLSPAASTTGWVPLPIFFWGYKE